jgi:hypothetical protein
MQLYRCDWLVDSQRTNISCALNAMQEKSLFMGLSDMPLIRGIETVSNDSQIGSQTNASSVKIISSRRESSALIDSLNETNSINSNSTSVKTFQLDGKHDTRIVNEAFQVKKFFIINVINIIKKIKILCFC